MTEVFMLAIDLDDYWHPLGYFPTEALADQAWEKLKPSIDPDYRDNQLIIAYAFHETVDVAVLHALRTQAREAGTTLREIGPAERNEIVDYTEHMAEVFPGQFRTLTRLQVDAMGEDRRQAVYQWLWSWNAEWSQGDPSPSDAPMELLNSTPDQVGLPLPISL